MPDRLRVIFAGTPDFAAGHLQALLDDARHDVVAVYCQPDRPAGRGKTTRPGPVKNIALAAGIDVFQPQNFRDAADLAVLQGHGADLMVVVAYGLLLPQAVLDTPRLGCINVHASLLPRWRGAAPIQRALAAGDRRTGVTIMQMDAGLDTGPMLLKSEVAIDDRDSGGSLHDKLLALGRDTLVEALTRIAEGKLTPTAQRDGDTCYAPKIDKQEARIDWRLPATQLALLIRAFNPVPVCFSELDGERIKLWWAQPTRGSGAAGVILDSGRDHIDVACGEGALRVVQLQLPGGKPLAVRDVMNARADMFASGRAFAL